MPKKFYLTTAIAYVDAPPHMGHVLQFVRTDVLARYYRLEGKDVFFLTGTDEHGSKLFKTAEQNKISPQELVDKNAAKFKELDNLLNISYNDFIRTTDRKKHWPGAQLIWKKLEEKGDLYKDKYQGHYCSGCEAYLTEKDLVNGKCIYHDKAPEFLDEENYFFRLSKYSDKLLKLLKSDEIEIIPASRKKEALNIIKSGLRDVSFSRPKEVLPWGIPVPGDNKQVMYVWCDALTNYISALGYGSANLKKFKKYWPADLHILGKDNLRFHAIYWPAMLMSAGLPLPKKIYVHGFIISGGQKMSKTIGNVVDPFEIIRKYGVDPLRYFLLREIPAYEDGDFTEQKFRERYNGELANGLGNFTARVLTLASKAKIKAASRGIDKDIIQKIKQTKKEINNTLPDFKFSEALSIIWNLISFGDKYVNQNKPWEKGDKKKEAKNKKTIINLIAILDGVAELLKPFLPETSEKISKNIKKPEKKPTPLFPRLN
ncbi:MAG: methionine--tRNA ligase [Candidatus Paceibacterota bacterium]